MVPCAMLPVIGADACLTVIGEFPCVKGVEQRRIPGLRREPLTLALGGRDLQLRTNSLLRQVPQEHGHE